MNAPEEATPKQPEIYNPVTKRTEPLTPMQVKAMDPEWTKANPALASIHMWRPNAPENSFAYRAGDWLRNTINNPNNPLSAATNAGPGYGGLAGAAAMALPVLGGMFAYNRLLADGSPESKWNTPLWTTLAALAGAGLGAYSGYHRSGQAALARQQTPEVKTAGFREGIGPTMFLSPNQQLSDKLTMIPGMSAGERARLQMGVQQLSPAQAQQLMSLVGGLGGAALAAAVARYLLGAGILATAAAGFLGFQAGRSMLGGPRNSVGLPTRAGPYMGGSYNF